MVQRYSLKKENQDKEILSCSIGDAVGINRHFKEKNTDSHFNIYLGGTRSAQAQQIPVSSVETVQNPDSSQVNGLPDVPRRLALGNFEHLVSLSSEHTDRQLKTLYGSLSKL